MLCNASGCLGLAEVIDGLFCTVVVVVFLSMYEGKLGFCVASGILDIIPEVSGAFVSTLRRGDLS